MKLYRRQVYKGTSNNLVIGRLCKYSSQVYLNSNQANKEFVLLILMDSIYHSHNLEQLSYQKFIQYSIYLLGMKSYHHKLKLLLGSTFHFYIYDIQLQITNQLHLNRIQLDN